MAFGLGFKDIQTYNNTGNGKKMTGDGGYENAFLFGWQLLILLSNFIFFLLLSLIERECWGV